MVNPDRNLYEPPYDDALLYDTDLEPERPRSRPLVVLLGIVVLAAFAGVVWVAYNQGVKQGQNGLPVLTADAGPTRIVPDPATASPAIDPAPAKSYDRLMSSEPEGDQVNMLPKPEQPKTTPSPQDLAAVTPPADESVGGKFGTKASDFEAPLDPGMDPTVGAISGAPAASEDITAALPPRDAATKPAPTALAPVKPVQPKAVQTPAPAPVPEKPAAVDLAPPSQSESTAAPSGVMIQLGSFPNATLAASAWSKIKSANQDLFADHSPAFNRAEIPGKGTWYRLRVGGFADKAAAKVACEQLAATGQACIIAAK